MLGTTDWLLKRFLKFVLKRNVGKYLCSEIDLEQLDVKLDAGKLELKNLLLNCEAINKDLVSMPGPLRAVQRSAALYATWPRGYLLNGCRSLFAHRRSRQDTNPRLFAQP